MECSGFTSAGKKEAGNKEGTGRHDKMQRWVNDIPGLHASPQQISAYADAIINVGIPTPDHLASLVTTINDICDISARIREYGAGHIHDRIIRKAIKAAVNV